MIDWILIIQCAYKVSCSWETNFHSCGWVAGLRGNNAFRRDNCGVSRYPTENILAHGFLSSGKDFFSDSTTLLSWISLWWDNDQIVGIIKRIKSIEIINLIAIIRTNKMIKILKIIKIIKILEIIELIRIKCEFHVLPLRRSVINWQNLSIYLCTFL